MAQTRLPKAHFSAFTWVAIAAIFMTIALYVAWAIWVAGPTIMR